MTWPLIPMKLPVESRQVSGWYSAHPGLVPDDTDVTRPVHVPQSEMQFAPLGYERMYLLLFKVADTPFNIISKETVYQT